MRDYPSMPEGARDADATRPVLGHPVRCRPTRVPADPACRMHRLDRVHMSGDDLQRPPMVRLLALATLPDRAIAGRADVNAPQRCRRATPAPWGWSRRHA